MVNMKKVFSLFLLFLLAFNAPLHAATKKTLKIFPKGLVGEEKSDEFITINKYYDEESKKLIELEFLLCSSMHSEFICEEIGQGSYDIDKFEKPKTKELIDQFSLIYVGNLINTVSLNIIIALGLNFAFEFVLDTLNNFNVFPDNYFFKYDSTFYMTKMGPLFLTKKLPTANYDLMMILKGILIGATVWTSINENWTEPVNNFIINALEVEGTTLSSSFIDFSFHDLFSDADGNQQVEDYAEFKSALLLFLGQII